MDELLPQLGEQLPGYRFGIFRPRSRDGGFPHDFPAGPGRQKTGQLFK
jgi:hypothetical protein